MMNLSSTMAGVDGGGCPSDKCLCRDCARRKRLISLGFTPDTVKEFLEAPQKEGN